MTILWCLFAAVAADDEPLAKGLQSLAAAGNYRFTVSDGGTATPVEGKYQKGEPLALKADRIDFFRKADVLVYLYNGSWQRTRTGTVSDPLIILGASAKARAVRTPHEELTQIVKLMRAPFRTDAKGQIIFTADLTEAAAKDLARTEDRDLARGGNVEFRLDDQGRVNKYELYITIKGRRGNADVDGKVTKIVTFGDIGETKVDVPAAARKVLE
jgi:hypothetical protein